jgi:hypothetical protein
MRVPALRQSVANTIRVQVFPFAFYLTGEVATFGFLAVMYLRQALFTWR